MKRKMWIATGLVFALVAAFPVASSAKKPSGVPATLSCSAYGVGSGAYTMLAFFGDAWLKEYGLKLRVVPAGTDMARMIPLRSREVQFCSSGVAAYFAQEGIYEYADRAWGPQDFRYLWIAQHPGCALEVRGDSDIRNLSELKGKRVPYIPGAAAVNVAVESFLKAGGLTWKDVVRIEMPSYGAAAAGVITGTVDTCFFNVTGGKMYELEASPHGIRYLCPPASDKKAWKAMTSILPFFTAFRSTIGAGISKDKPTNTMIYPYPIFVAYKDLPDDVAYFITKATHESYAMVSAKDASGKMKLCWSMEANLNLFEKGGCWPYHNGTIRYLKEKGLWKEEYEKINQAAIERQEKLKSLWKKTVAEADAKNLGDKEFTKLWLKTRATAFGE